MRYLVVLSPFLLAGCTWLGDNLVKCPSGGCPDGQRCWNDVCIPVFEPTPPPTPSPSPSPTPTPVPTPSPTPNDCRNQGCPLGGVCVQSDLEIQPSIWECVPPTPSPTPVPTPTPAPTPTPVVGPLSFDEVTGNYITPASINVFPWEGGVCPVEFKNTLAWVGIVFTNEVPVVPCTKDPQDPCLGKRYNFDATPHSVPPFCYHHTLEGQVKVLRCEQARACINPAGPDFWMRNAHWSGWHPCDKHSANKYKCHHVPRANETGPTEVCAVPQGDVPSSGRGRCVNKNVQ